jgi:hypothetical protein
MTTLTVDPEKIACDIALAPPVDGLALSPDARAAIDTAPKHTEDIDFRRVTRTPEIARDLIDYFNAAAVRLQTSRRARPIDRVCPGGRRHPSRAGSAWGPSLSQATLAS